MHLARCTNSLFAVALILLSGSVILAQPVRSISTQGTVMSAIPCGWSAPMLPVTFTASWKTTAVQKRADGVVVTYVSLLKVAQDNTGRSYRETHLPKSSTENTPDRFFVYLSDPGRDATINWNSDTKEAVIFHKRNPPQPTRPSPLSAAASSNDCPQMPPPQPPSSESSVEHLGPKMINGLEATGTRFNSINSPAATGSEKPVISVIEEFWSSPEYGVAVLHTVKHLNGDLITREELVSFESGTPDPAVFEIPADYTVRDVYQ
jgi:hypothetical protein